MRSKKPVKMTMLLRSWTSIQAIPVVLRGDKFYDDTRGGNRSCYWSYKYNDIIAVVDRKIGNKIAHNLKSITENHKRCEVLLDCLYLKNCEELLQKHGVRKKLTK